MTSVVPLLATVKPIFAGCSIAQSFLFPSKQKWVDALEAALPGHQLIAQETLVATHIAVFVSDSRAEFSAQPGRAL